MSTMEYIKRGLSGVSMFEFSEYMPIYSESSISWTEGWVMTVGPIYTNAVILPLLISTG